MVSMIRVIFAVPGVVIHELGHYLFCRLCGARVQEVCFFEPAGPSGYVVHQVPPRLGQHGIIVAGPLVVNSALAFLLFRTATAGALAIGRVPADRLPPQAGVLALAVILGTSIGLQAIPSLADASSLWTVTLERLRRGQVLAALAVPPALALILVNHLRRFWIDWLYVAALAALAALFPGQ